MADLKGRWALVTGASSGLGSDFAQILAERGSNVVLVARREDRLRKLAQRIEDDSGVETRVIPLDLSRADAPDALHARTRAEGIAVDVLVNNAGFGLYGPFASIPWEREREMLEVDILALTRLTKLYVSDMLERDLGYVLQLASVGAYQPSPTYATYSAAKSYVLHFGEALSWELRGTGVNVSVLSPGITRTEFLQVSGQRPSLYQRLLVMDSRKVAEIGVRALLRGKPSVIPGVTNKLLAWSLRLTPRRLQAATAHLAMSLG